MEGYKKREEPVSFIVAAESEMGTPQRYYPQSNGTGFYPSLQAQSMPGSGGSQAQHSDPYSQQMASLHVQPQGPFFPHPHISYCSCHGQVLSHLGSLPTTKQLDDFHGHNREVLYQQQEVHNQLQQNPHPQQHHQHQKPTQPVEKRPSSSDDQLRNLGEGNYGDVEMNDVTPTEEVTKQPLRSTAQPQEVVHDEVDSSLKIHISTAKTTYQGGHEQGSSRNSRQQDGGNRREGSVIPASQSQSKKKSQGLIEKAQNLAQNLFLGSSHDSDYEQADSSSMSQSRDPHSGNWTEEKAELLQIITALKTTNEEALKKKNDEFMRAKSEWMLQLDSVTKNHESKVAKLMSTITEYKTKMTDYKAIADKLTEQLSSLEQSNSKQVGGTGAHKDSHAIPPNLEKSATSVNQTALACTKTFINFLKERNAFESHEAVKNVPKQDRRYRIYAVESYICRVMFAGFENDSYLDSLDCLRSSKYLPADCEKTQFFLQHQDLELRYKQYLAQYDSVQMLGLQGIMDALKDTVDKNASRLPFLQFCCRKLVSIMDGVKTFSTDFPPSGNYSERFLLQQLATNAVYCDKFLKPFVNLAMAAFKLHRLAFQFHPPARIFRYAPGTPFDQAYMENAFPIDDDDSDEEFVVGLMLIPGFQVGATIIKCIVYLVKDTTPAS